MSEPPPVVLGRPPALCDEPVVLSREGGVRFSRDDTASRFLASLDREEMAQAAAGDSGKVPATLLGVPSAAKPGASKSAPAALPSGLATDVDGDIVQVSVQGKDGAALPACG